MSAHKKYTSKRLSSTELFDTKNQLSLTRCLHNSLNLQVKIDGSHNNGIVVAAVMLPGETLY